MRTRFSGLLAAVSVALPLAWATPVAATVSDYGGYYESFPADFATLRGLGLKIERLYNSFSSTNGIFGEGWGSDFEVRLEVRDDGSVDVHEYGSAAENIFKPTDPKQLRPLDAVVDEIVAAAEKVGQFGSDAELQSYRRWLVANHVDEWRRFRDLGLVAAKHLGVGATFYSDRFSSELITRVPEGYQLQAGATFQVFDLSGRLLREWDTNHNFISLRYDSHGHLTEIEDNFGDRYVFTFNDSGYVASITDASNLTVRYEYSGQQLTRVFNVDGKPTTYEYDANLNMTAIKYPNKTFEEISYTYSAVAEDYQVSRVKATDGTVTVYTFTNDGADHYSIAQTATSADGKKVTTEKKEYYFTYDASHNRHMARQIITLDGKTTDTAYNLEDEAVTVTRDGVVEQLTYDDLGHVIKTQTPAETDEYQYDNVIGKVVAYTQTTGSKVARSRFQYDPKGNLIHAADDAGDDFTLAWDDVGRLSVATDQTGQSIRFTYSGVSRPDSIVMSGVGTLRVTWTANGDVDTLKADEGDAAKTKIVAFFVKVRDFVTPTRIGFW